MKTLTNATKCLFALAALPLGVSYAESVLEVGASSTVDWAGASWSDGVPDISKDARISAQPGGRVDVSAPAEAKTLTLEDSAELYVLSGGSLTLDGNLTAEGSSSFNVSGSAGALAVLNMESGRLQGASENASINIDYADITGSFGNINGLNISNSTIRVNNTAGNSLFQTTSNTANVARFTNVTINAYKGGAIGGNFFHIGSKNADLVFANSKVAGSTYDFDNLALNTYLNAPDGSWYEVGNSAMADGDKVRVAYTGGGEMSAWGVAMRKGGVQNSTGGAIEMEFQGTAENRMNVAVNTFEVGSNNFLTADRNHTTSLIFSGEARARVAAFNIANNQDSMGGVNELVVGGANNSIIADNLNLRVSRTAGSQMLARADIGGSGTQVRSWNVNLGLDSSLGGESHLKISGTDSANKTKWGSFGVALYNSYNENSAALNTLEVGSNVSMGGWFWESEDERLAWGKNYTPADPSGYNRDGRLILNIGVNTQNVQFNVDGTNYNDFDNSKFAKSGASRFVLSGSGSSVASTDAFVGSLGSAAEAQLRISGENNEFRNTGWLQVNAGAGGKSEIVVEGKGNTFYVGDLRIGESSTVYYKGQDLNSAVSRSEGDARLVIRGGGNASVSVNVLRVSSAADGGIGGSLNFEVGDDGINTLVANQVAAFTGALNVDFSGIAAADVDQTYTLISSATNLENFFSIGPDGNIVGIESDIGTRSDGDVVKFAFAQDGGRYLLQVSYTSLIPEPSAYAAAAALAALALAGVRRRR